MNNTQGQLLAIAGGQSLEHNGAYGVYLNFLQKLINGPPATPSQGLSGFVNVTFADRQTATLDNQIAQVVPTDIIRHYQPIFSINEEAWWLHQR